MTAHSVNELCWDLVGYEMVAVKKIYNSMHCATVPMSISLSSELQCKLQAALTLHLASYPPPIGQPPLSFLAFQRNQIKSQPSQIDTNILYRLYPTRTEIMGNKSEEPIQIPGKTNWHKHLLTSLKCDTNITSNHLFGWPRQLLNYNYDASLLIMKS